MKQWLQTEWDYASWSESTMESAIMGTVEECVEQLEPHLATGIDRIIFVPYRYENEQVEAVAKEIIPRLRKKMAMSSGVAWALLVSVGRALLSSRCDGVTNLGTSRPSDLEGGASRQYGTSQQREMRMKATALRFALAAAPPARCSSAEPPRRRTPSRSA